MWSGALFFFKECVLNFLGNKNYAMGKQMIAEVGNFLLTVPSQEFSRQLNLQVSPSNASDLTDKLGPEVLLMFHILLMKSDGTICLKL